MSRIDSVQFPVDGYTSFDHLSKDGYHLLWIDSHHWYFDGCKSLNWVKHHWDLTDEEVLVLKLRYGD
jgi:hypothetical protein